MKYVVFTYDGYGLPIAQRLQQEGREVTVAFVEDQTDILHPLEKNVSAEGDDARQRRLSLYDGLLNKVPAGEVMAKLAKEKHPAETFLFFDLNHLFRFAEPLQDLGFLGNFPLVSDHELEIDRERAKDFVDRDFPRLRVAEKRRFKKASEAKAFLADSEEMWVLKGLEENARTVVPDVEDADLAKGQILEALAQHPDEYESAGFLLELLIPNALELTPQKVWFDGQPVYTSMCIENKPMGSGNVGPMTDCTQDLIFATDPSARINNIAFPPVIEEMARQRKGLFVWDASLLIDGRTGAIYFGEFCANRFGYNSLYTELALAGSASGFFESVIQGKNPHPENAVATSVRLFNFHRDGQGSSLRGSTIRYKERVEGDLWFTDVRQERGRLTSAGFTDTLAVATGSGRSVGEAAKRAYRAVDEFSFEGAYYRPIFDLLSRDYKSAILNRLDYGLTRGFYKVGFGIR